MSTALIALIPVAGAIIPPLLQRSGNNACAAAAASVSCAALLLLLLHAPEVYAGEAVGFRADWIPLFHLTFSFFVDPLGLFFAGLILGMGLLVILYARFYLGGGERIGRFYGLLLLFQGAMLGIVLSDNVVLMLVFWELTSLSSFLLIGYWHRRPDSRQGARMALIVTGGGGLALIAGMLMLGGIAGSYELSEIIRRGEQVRSSPLYAPTLALILVGAFTKSAQFPFHFWLPHAMAAPTPVSAYLHSATMVKAGVFLLARLWPVLAGTDLWFLVVSLTGLVTMLVAAWIALFKNDLKQLLAYSTVSHLGLITMLLGIGSRLAVVAAVFHILNHAAFKASLFMSGGIIDHEAGTRDIRRLGGLAKVMPLTAALTAVGAAAMAGVPLLNGFVSKEMMLEQAAGTVYAGVPWLFPLLCSAGALLSAAYSFRLAGVLFGSARHAAPRPPHDPPLGMWLPVAVLIVPVIAFGVMPELAQPLVARTASAVIGGPLPAFHLAVWHGVSPALAMSAVALLGGLLLLTAYRSLGGVRHSVPRPDAKRLFERTLDASAAAARRCIDSLHSNELQRYILIIVLTVGAAGVIGFRSAGHVAGARSGLDASVPGVVVWIALAAVCALAALRHHERLLMLMVTGVAGLVVALVFLQFSAPDLALTQISVEIVTTILLLLALNVLPKTTRRETRAGQRIMHLAAAVTGGAAVASIAYAVLTRGFDSISGYHLAQSLPGGGGSNVVNVILVDFRGYDTFGEIIVLGIAALAIFALLDRNGAVAVSRRLAAARPQASGGEAHPLMFGVAARVLFPLVLTVGIYIFLRGHNLPGGGFIAGIVVAIAFVLQYIASGYQWTHERRRFDAHTLIGGGVMLAGLTGVGSWTFGFPFLTSTHAGLDIPLLGHVELASVIAFDLGVFLVVVGTVLLALASISRVEPAAADGRAAQPLDQPERPRRPIAARVEQAETV